MRYMLIALLLTGCIAQWDYPAVPKQDPDTCEWRTEYVYWPVERRRVRCVPRRVQDKDQSYTGDHSATGERLQPE